MQTIKYNRCLNLCGGGQKQFNQQQLTRFSLSFLFSNIRCYQLLYTDNKSFFIHGYLIISLLISLLVEVEKLCQKLVNTLLFTVFFYPIFQSISLAFFISDLAAVRSFFPQRKKYMWLFFSWLMAILELLGCFFKISQEYWHFDTMFVVVLV